MSPLGFPKSHFHAACLETSFDPESNRELFSE